MKTKVIKNISYLVSTIIIGIVFGVSLQFVKAWTEPTTIAPEGNIGAPINTSGTTQIKIGSFGSSGSISAEGSVQGKTSLCIGNDCRSTWPSGGGTTYNAGTGISISGTTISNTGDINANDDIITDNSSQIKAGALGINGALRGYSNAVFDSNVGIGISNPTTKLDINGKVKITDGTQGTGRVLTSSSSGLASWQTISGGTGTVTQVSTGTGLTGGPITTTGTISADTTYLQRRVTATCATGSSIKTINADGTVVCQIGQITQPTCTYGSKTYSATARCYLRVSNGVTCPNATSTTAYKYTENYCNVNGTWTNNGSAVAYSDCNATLTPLCGE